MNKDEFLSKWCNTEIDEYCMCNDLDILIEQALADNVDTKELASWIPVGINPTKNGDYAVVYRGGHVGKLYWWYTNWCNGNVVVSQDIEFWFELPPKKDM